MDLFHGFHPADVTNPFAPSLAFLGPADHAMAHTDGESSRQTQSMRLHGRPYGLVCAMLRVAHGKNDVRLRTQAMVEDVNLDELVDVDMRKRIEDG